MPPPLVPFTMQTFAVFFTLLLLGGKRGTLSVLVYLLLGAAGVPVFSHFTGGAGVLLGPTGGYLIGFLLTGLIYLAAEQLSDRRLLAAALPAGLLVCYAFGTAWFLVVYTRTKGAVSVGTALTWCVLPFVIPDLAKLWLAHFLAARVRSAVRSRSLS